MAYVRLLSGIWAEALEVLREKSYDVLRLFDPQGAECDDLPYEELAKVFGTYEEGSKAWDGMHVVL